MSAAVAVRAALVAAIGVEPELAGIAVQAGGPAGAVLPRIEVAEPAAGDWSAKGMRGRELRTAAIVRVAEGQRARIAAMAEAVERAGESLAGDIGGWRVAGAVFVRSRGIAEKGLRAVLVEHRVRVVAE